jgi:cell division protein FtsI (penicillin-binding protein 3)
MTADDFSSRIAVPKVEATPDSHDLVHTRSKQLIVLLGVAGAIVLGVLAARGVQLTVYPVQEAVEWSNVWRGMNDQDRTVPVRGSILDREGRVLAISEDRGRFTVSPRYMNQKKAGRDYDRAAYAKKMAERFAPFVSMPEDEISEILTNGSSDRLIDGNLSSSAVARIRKIIRDESTDFHNAYAKTELIHKREYTERVAPQVLGFVNSNSVGIEGLEAHYNSWLLGTQARRSAVNKKNRGGAQLHALSEPGANIQTTLDAHLQWFVEQELAQIQVVSEPEWSTAVLIDVKSGDILAMANTPTYDPNASKDRPEARRNHALLDFPEPGSVVKPLGMAIALEAGVVSPNDMVDCENGKYRVGRRTIHDDHPSGVVPLGGVIKYSSNICSAKIAARVGARGFIQGFKDFGFGQPTDYPADWVGKGVLRNPATIRPIELATTSFGQGMTASPLQVVMAIAALANQGVLMKPRIVSSVKDSEGEILKQFLPEPVRRVVSVETARAITQMMVSVMEPEGTGQVHAIEGLSIAGKTGTAQIVDAETKGYGKERTASFVGYAPAEDPQVAVIVVSYRPQKGIKYGSVVTGKAFSRILAESVRYLGGAEDNSAALSTEQSESALLKKATPEVRVAETQDGLVLPDFAGLAMREALDIASASGLHIEIGGSGYAHAQKPNPGAVVARGSTISIEFH